MRATVKSPTVAYHRNGISGQGFHVVTFTFTEAGVTHRMVATVFEQAGHVAVLDVTETAAGNIGMAQGNSWRGDNFEPALRAAIAAYEKARS